MINSIISLLFNIFGITISNTGASGFLGNAISMISVIFLVVGFIMALVNFFSSLMNIKGNLAKFLFSMISLGFSIYGFINSMDVIKNMLNIL